MQRISQLAAHVRQRRLTPPPLPGHLAAPPLMPAEDAGAAMTEGLGASPAVPPPALAGRSQSDRHLTAPALCLAMAKQLHPFGVEIEAGISDLDGLREALPALLAQHGLVVVNGLLALRPRQLVHLLTVFGPEEQMLEYTSTPVDPEGASGGGGGGAAHTPESARVRVLGNSTHEATGRPTSLLAKIGYEWHVDGSAACLSCLHCKETPAGAGAETLFADSAALFERLSTAQRAEATGLQARFSNRFTAGSPAAFDAAFGLRMDPTGTRVLRGASRRRESWALNAASRPLAAYNPATGRHHILGGAKNLDQIAGLSVGASRRKLAELLLAGLRPTMVGEIGPDLRTTAPTVFDPSVVLAHRWQPGQVTDRGPVHCANSLDCPLSSAVRVYFVAATCRCVGALKYDDRAVPAVLCAAGCVEQREVLALDNAGRALRQGQPADVASDTQPGRGASWLYRRWLHGEQTAPAGCQPGQPAGGHRGRLRLSRQVVNKLDLVLCFALAR
eukprot:SAG22_NODE_71_length_22540_cov_8.918052_1_plen_503_part_00